MKPERVQFWQRVIATARSVASNVCGVLGWIESVAAGLKRAFRCGNTGRKA